MPSYSVNVNGYFSDSILVEADDEYEAMELAVAEFEENASIYLNNLGATVGFDQVEADSWEEDEDA